MEEKKNDGLQIAEDVVATVAEIGVTLIISDITGSFEPKNARKIGKICRMIGELALNGIVKKPIDNYIHETFEDVRNVIDRVKNAQNQIEETKEETDGCNEAAGSEA